MNLPVPRTLNSSKVATWAKFWHLSRVVKTLALEDIYADPHKLDFYLESGESVEVVRDERAVAELVPRKATAESTAATKRPRADYRARFLKMWGPDAFESQVSVPDRRYSDSRMQLSVRAFAQDPYPGTRRKDLWSPGSGCDSGR